MNNKHNIDKESSINKESSIDKESNINKELSIDKESNINKELSIGKESNNSNESGVSKESSINEEENMRGDIQWERYERQMILPGVGKEGQDALHRARILIVGAGGLGSPAALYLAGAGVGKLGLMDADEVSVTNLHRQIIHPTANLGKNKALSAKEELERRNDQVEIAIYPYFLTEENAQEIISQYDFVIDAVDNFVAKFLINDTCVALKKPFCHAGVVGFQGQVLSYVPDQGPCYRCIFDDVPEGDVPTASTAGILGPMAGIIGCIQAMEAIKYFFGVGELLTGKMYILDGLTMKTRIARFPGRTPGCKACDPEE